MISASERTFIASRLNWQKTLASIPLLENIILHQKQHLASRLNLLANNNGAALMISLLENIILMFKNVNIENYISKRVKKFDKAIR